MDAASAMLRWRRREVRCCVRRPRRRHLDKASSRPGATRASLRRARRHACAALRCAVRMSRTCLPL
jgi:hypothetical protein